MTELNGFVSATYYISINIHLFKVITGLVFESTLSEPEQSRF